MLDKGGATKPGMINTFRDAINTFREMQTNLNIHVEMALIAQSQSLGDG